MLRQTTPPASEPLDVAELERHCKCEGLGQAPVLAGYLAAARRYAEQRTRRQLLPATWELRRSCWPTDERGEARGLALPRPPLIAVVSVEYVDTSGDLQTWPADQYQVRTDGDVSELWPASGVTWPTVQVDRTDAVRVTWQAGYASPAWIPATILQGLRLLVAFWFDNRADADAVGLQVIPKGADALFDLEAASLYG